MFSQLSNYYYCFFTLDKLFYDRIYINLEIEIEIPVFGGLQYNFLGHVIGYKIDILISRISVNDDITLLGLQI